MIRNFKCQYFLNYVKGFRNTHVLQAESNCLPKITNPQLNSQYLNTEQFSGPGGFTGEIQNNGPLKLWFYKKHRSVYQGVYKLSDKQLTINLKSSGCNPIKYIPQTSKKDQDFIDSLELAFDNDHQQTFTYKFNQNSQKAFHSMDGEMLIQPSKGQLIIQTECGILEIEPEFICVIPKNMKFKVECKEPSFGLITELKNDRSWNLPGKGPIGANGLANSEYFEGPVPFCDSQTDQGYQIICKKQNQLYSMDSKYSPFDIKAWKGNYYPYRFNLNDFVPVVSGSRDHLDPSSHLVLVVPDSNGANLVEFVAFVPRMNYSDPENPTYLPPYDHRNNGKSELMHYIGQYDARQAQTGMITLHDMGINHGNSYEVFNKARINQNSTVKLQGIATMIESTGYLNTANHILKNQDTDYLKSYEQQDDFKEIPEKYEIGQSQNIVFTAYEQSLLPLFNFLMPNPEIIDNQKNGLKKFLFRTCVGKQFEVKVQQDLNNFWEMFKGKQISQEQRSVNQLSDQELQEAVNTIKVFMQRGTTIEQLQMYNQNPEESAKFYKASGLFEGINKKSFKVESDATFNFGLTDVQKFEINSESKISYIDHTVFNSYEESVNRFKTLLPKVFWGGDPRDLRAPGVQFWTQVLNQNLKDVKHLIPLNNLDIDEENLLKRIQNNDTFVPPYLKEQVMKNQISRGLFDANRCMPQNTNNSFLQHIALQINPEKLNIQQMIQQLKDAKINLIPAPNKFYYELSEIDLSQRICIPILFEMFGYNAFDLPYQIYNGLLKPKDCQISRINQILDQVNYKQDKENLLQMLESLIPIFELIGNSTLNFNPDVFVQELKKLFDQQNIKYTSEQIQQIVKLIEYNKQKLSNSHKCGSLIDFQIIFEENQSGYLDQTFSTPVNQITENSSVIFFEFIERTSYPQILDQIKGSFKRDINIFNSAGAFGQGNFANLMIGQQMGIEKIDQQIKQEAKKQGGYQFVLPLIDSNTIKNNPLKHLEDAINDLQNKGDKNEMQKCINNLKQIIEMAKEKKFW